MFSHALYNVVHIVGLLLLVSALGGAALLGMSGVGRSSPARRMLAVLHGSGAFLVLLGGFGMLARLGIVQGGSFPAWLWVKIAVWVVLGAALVIPYRRPGLSRALLLAIPVLGGLAAYMAIYKPI
jgi:hypothetical protein